MAFPETPFALSPPPATVERHGQVDLHLPTEGGRRPAVVVVHGVPLPPGAPDPRDWLLYQGYGALLAEAGLVAGVVSYSVTDLARMPEAADDLATMVEQVRADPRVDADRLVLWFFSGSGLFLGDWLRASPPWLRGIAATYPLLAPMPGWVLGPRFHPVEALDAGRDLPFVLTRAGRDMPVVATAMEAFLTAADEKRRPIRVIDVPNGQHGFEVLDHTEESRAAVRTVRDAVVELLTA
ncbi:dienelactone hydrolase family protein [Micromonospora sp. BQ11]|uniref:dienelactone hydrolase family protein n=1 Tax=Micromonospora sp. BQ11 TaxID=3452212 RepID=UPI003F8B5F1B